MDIPQSRQPRRHLSLYYADETFLMLDYTGAGCSTGCESWAHQNRLGSVVAVSDGEAPGE
ncbi:hypothetical protein GCM10011342_27240 [Aquisalinus flavus]|uniref:Uncharacterized protein n=1 Tax=Aquisalinus flavus TaxID=1526572 RepID=A0A8J2V3Y0_9PROT|nr:hypothetical protein GCM10011342_27240 [Aquisalinus flavus]